MSVRMIHLGSGRYYARWIERGVGAEVRLCCGCGYVSSPYLDAFWLEESADYLHGKH